MTALRIASGIVRGPPLTFTIDGVAIVAHAGETVGAALLAAGLRDLRGSPGGAPRGMFCAMGICQECAVLVDGIVQEACRLPVRDGLVVTTRRLRDGR